MPFLNSNIIFSKREILKVLFTRLLLCNVIEGKDLINLKKKIKDFATLLYI